MGTCLPASGFVVVFADFLTVLKNSGKKLNAYTVVDYVYCRFILFITLFANEFWIYYSHDAVLVLAVALCQCLSLSVCLSQVGVLSKWMDGLSRFLACRLLSSYPMLCFKEFQVYTKRTGTLFETPGLENFALAYRSLKHFIDLP